MIHAGVTNYSVLTAQKISSLETGGGREDALRPLLFSPIIMYKIAAKPDPMDVFGRLTNEKLIYHTKH